MQEITEEQFTAAMEQAVEERGADFVYPEEWKNESGTCVYWKDGVGPACIIGKALAILGATEQELYSNGIALNKIRVITGLSQFVLYPPFFGAAQSAQNVQDGRGSWGEALEAYKTRLRTLHNEQAEKDRRDRNG